MIRAFVYTPCTSCRKTEEALQSSGTHYERRDYFRERFTRDELAGILEQAGLHASDVLSKRSKAYKARSLEIDDLSDEELIDLMIEEPTLLRRPLVVGSDGVVVGHNPMYLERLIADNRQV